MQPIPIVIAIGSNAGDSVSLVSQALTLLKSIAVKEFQPSSLFDTSPVDCPPGSGRFVNAVATFFVSGDLSPVGLLDQLQSWERELGRRPKKVHNEPRSLDLDLIAFGSLSLTTDRLTVPHPRAHLRRFVLEPLSEIQPKLILPGQQRSVAELLASLDSNETVRRIFTV